MRIQLKDIAYGRSGDKGDISNIGLIAKNTDAYAVMKKTVTPESVKAFFGDMVRGEVFVYPLDNIECLQVVCMEALGGGATRTLRMDVTGKAMCTALLRMYVEC